MPNWMCKAMFQGMMSLLPKPQFWNYLLQRYITRSTLLDTMDFENMLERKCKKHMNNYFEVMGSTAHFSVFELGTGWFPILPISLYLSGASEVYTDDTVPLLRAKNVQRVFHLFREYIEKDKLKAYLPTAINGRIYSLMKILKDFELLHFVDILEKLNIHVINCDARNTSLPTSSIDLFVSNNTLEHIPKDVLLGIFIELARLARPKAVMSHYIDMSDHYAYFDHSISVYNFLKYSNTSYRLFNNLLHYQNRLRIADYRELHETTEWTIIKEESTKGSLEDLRRINMARELQKYTEDQLLVIQSWITSARHEK